MFIIIILTYTNIARENFGDQPTSECFLLQHNRAFSHWCAERSAQSKQPSRSSVDGIDRPVQLRMHASCNLNRSRRRINTGTQLGKCESSKLVIPCRGSSHRRRERPMLRARARVCVCVQFRAVNAFLRSYLSEGGEG